MIILSYNIAIADEISVSTSVVEPPFKASQGELVLVKPLHDQKNYFWGILLDPIVPGSDQWTCQCLTDQEFSDHIKKELMDKEKSREWSEERILASYQEGLRRREEEAVSQL